MLRMFPSRLNYDYQDWAFGHFWKMIFTANERYTIIASIEIIANSKYTPFDQKY